MAINFPASPSTDETYTENSITWVFNGTAWNALGEQITPSDIGLGNVDNTADTAKPVSTAQQTALDLKQDDESLNVSGIANLEMWLDASKLPLADGDDVVEWPDISGQGHSGYQTTGANRPTFAARSNVMGLPAVRFNGSSEWLRTDGWLPASAEQNLTIFGVIASDDGTAMSWLGMNAGSERFSTSAQQDPFYTGSSIYSPTADATTTKMLAFNYDGAVRRAWNDGGEVFSGALTGDLGITGGDISIGSRTPTSATVPYDGDIAELIVFTRSLSDTEMSQVYGYLQRKYYTDRLSRWVVFDGDSLTYGQGVTNGTHYPPVTVAATSRQWHGVNVAIGGQKLGSMTTAGPTRVDTQYDATREKNVLVIWSSNDLSVSTAAETHDLLEAYCLARQAAGWTVLVCNATPRTTSGFNTLRNAYNVLIAANYTDYADGLIDLAADSTIGDDADASNATYYGDGVHMTTAGYAIVAGLVTTALDAL